MGHAASQGMFFGIFVLNRVLILSFFLLIRVSILSIFVLNRISFLFLDDKQPPHMFYELNYSKTFFFCFGLNILNRVSKIGILS